MDGSSVVLADTPQGPALAVGPSGVGAAATVSSPSSLSYGADGRITAITGGAPLATALQKANVRLVAIANQALSGTPVIDGVQTAVNDKVLLTGQTAGHENGVYVVASGAWSRRSDLDTSAEMVPGVWMRVMEGTRRGRWFLSTTGTITLGTTALTFEKDGRAGNGLRQDGETTSLKESGVAAARHPFGSYITTAETGVITRVEHGVTLKAFVMGLRLAHEGDRIIGVSAGAAYIPGHSGLFEAPLAMSRDAALIFGGLSANTWYYVYFINAGSDQGTLELSTTAPQLYMNDQRFSAAQMGGDATRRYLGAFLTNSAGHIHNFLAEGSDDTLTYWYQTDTTAAPFRVHTDGTGTSLTSVNCATVTPANSRVAIVRVINNSDMTCRITNKQVSGTVFPSSVSPGGQVAALRIPLIEDRVFRYVLSGTPTFGGVTFDVVGFVDRR